MNSKYFLSAIHQRVESDGTERVEESMTQRLENILNSKRLVIHAVTLMQHISISDTSINKQTKKTLDTVAHVFLFGIRTLQLIFIVTSVPIEPPLKPLTETSALMQLDDILAHRRDQSTILISFFFFFFW